MTKLFHLALAMLLAMPSWAEIVFDASSETTGTTTISWTHTPSGTPRGVFVGIVEPGSHLAGDDRIDPCSYGGVTMTKLTPVAFDTSGEEAIVYGFFLGASIPTGPQTVTCTVHTDTGTTKWATAVTVTAGADTQLAGSEVATGYCDLNGNATNPSCTISSIAGASYAFGIMFSGHNNPTCTAGSAFTMRQDHDFGTSNAHSESSTSQQASGDQVIAFTCADEDQALAGIAIEETGGAPAYNPAAQQTLIIQ